MSLARYRLVAGELGKFIKRGPVLEIGSGTGRLLIEIARNVPDVYLTGIDISDEMIALSRLNTQKEGLSGRIEFREIPVEELSSFQENSFELVLSHASFSGWLRPEESLKEIAGILKPDGMLYISDWNRSAPMDAVSALARRALNEPEHLERIRMAFQAAYTGKELKKLLSDFIAETNKGGGPFRLIQFSTEEHWMTAVLKKI